MNLQPNLRRVFTAIRPAARKANSRRSTHLRHRPLQLERLEDRTLPSVIIPASNNSGQGYAGLDFNQTLGYVPPDSNGAAGPTNYVETVNQNIAIYSPKATGSTEVSKGFQSFFSSLPAVTNGFWSDPVIT